MISFLIGSGFSFAEGIPGVSVINKRFINLRADDIYLGSDQTAFFLEAGDKDLNGWFPQNVIDRKFVEGLLQFYIQKVVKDSSEFNYESFFDYYYLTYIKNSYPQELLDFLDDFRESISTTDRILYDNTNLLSRFHNIFSQLVVSILNLPKYHEDISFMNYPKYDSFIRFLSNVLSSQEIKVHSLNHDLFFEHLGSKHADLFEYYCDGYTSSGSPYYGDVNIHNGGVNQTYKGRIKFFNNEYDNKLCVYKLHGSIDTYIFNLASPNPDLTRIKRNWQVRELCKEVINPKTDKPEYESGFQYNYPDFLSGTTAKMLSYDNEHYSIIFDHFRHNLQNSETLFVVGYGFKDKKINDMIEENYLSKGRRMVVVDPFPKKDAYDKAHDIVYVEKKVTDLTYQEWVSYL